jgi:hypothetical protein
MTTGRENRSNVPTHKPDDTTPDDVQKPTPIVPDSADLATWICAAPVDDPTKSTIPTGAKVLSSIPVEEIQREEGMLRFFFEGDHKRALELARQILAVRPDDAVAATVVAQCEAHERDFDLKSVPVVVLAPKETTRGRLDGRSILLLSFIDGKTTVEALLRTTGIDRNEGMRILRELCSVGMIEVRKRA